MTIEFLKARIEGKAKEIAKLEKKLSRIEAAKATDWNTNPYYYSESDLKWTQRDLEKARATLVEYSDKLVAEIEKANSRNVQVILDFLAAWKSECHLFYAEKLPQYEEERNEYGRQDHELVEQWNHLYEIKDPDLRKARRAEIDKEQRDLRVAFRARWNWIEPYLICSAGYVNGVHHFSFTLDVEKLEKDLQEEADRKYDFIIERTNAIAGKITDASGLYIGDKGDLNGIIIGERGKAKVQTIGAGGWNIQRFHFRTLIREA